MKLANGRSINEDEYCPTLYKKVAKLTGVGEISVDIHGIGQKIMKMLPCVPVLKKETGVIRSFINMLWKANIQLLKKLSSCSSKIG